jgi:hypothetical protein
VPDTPPHALNAAPVAPVESRTLLAQRSAIGSPEDRTHGARTDAGV